MLRFCIIYKNIKIIDFCMLVIAAAKRTYILIIEHLKAITK